MNLENKTDLAIEKAYMIENLITILEASCDRNNYESERYVLALILNKQKSLIKLLEEIDLETFKLKITKNNYTFTHPHQTNSIILKLY